MTPPPDDAELVAVLTRNPAVAVLTINVTAARFPAPDADTDTGGPG